MKTIGIQPGSDRPVDIVGVGAGGLFLKRVGSAGSNARPAPTPPPTDGLVLALGPSFNFNNSGYPNGTGVAFYSVPQDETGAADFSIDSPYPLQWSNPASYLQPCVINTLYDQTLTSPNNATSTGSLRPTLQYGAAMLYDGQVYTYRGQGFFTEAAPRAYYTLAGQATSQTLNAIAYDGDNARWVRTDGSGTITDHSTESLVAFPDQVVWDSVTPTASTPTGWLTTDGTTGLATANPLFNTAWVDGVKYTVRGTANGKFYYVKEGESDNGYDGAWAIGWTLVLWRRYDATDPVDFSLTDTPYPWNNTDWDVINPTGGSQTGTIHCYMRRAVTGTSGVLIETGATGADGAAQLGIAWDVDDLRFKMSGAVTGQARATYTTSSTDFALVSITFDTNASTGAGQIQMYWNGVLVSGNTADTLTAGTTIGGDIANIGIRDLNGAASSGFAGDIMIIPAYDYAQTPTEIAAIWAWVQAWPTGAS